MARELIKTLNARETLWNLMSNSDLSFWQRGISFTNPSDGQYLADRFRVVKSGAMNVNVVRSTQVPTSAEAGYVFPFSMQIDTVSATSGATDYWGITQFVEGYDIAKVQIFGKKLYYTFWAKGANAAGTLAIQFRSTSGAHYYLRSVTIIGDNVWRKYSIEIPSVPAFSANWDSSNGRGLWVQHMLFAGTSFQSADSTSWATNASPPTYITGGSTLLDPAQSLFLTGFQLALAPETSFTLKHRTFDAELRHCQRYFEKTYRLGVTPGTATQEGRVTLIKSEGINEFYDIAYFKASKRDLPQMTAYNPSTGTAGQSSNGEAISFEGASENHVNLRMNSASGSPTRYVHWTAEAEL